MLDHSVAAREEDALAVVVPANAVVLVSGNAQELDDLAHPLGATLSACGNDDEISDSGWLLLDSHA